jgi:hypothetical protein
VDNPSEVAGHLASQLNEIETDRALNLIRYGAGTEQIQAATKFINAKAALLSAISLAIIVLTFIAVGVAVFALVHW